MVFFLSNSNNSSDYISIAVHLNKPLKQEPLTPVNEPVHLLSEACIINDAIDLTKLMRRNHILSCISARANHHNIPHVTSETQSRNELAHNPLLDCTYIHASVQPGAISLGSLRRVHTQDDSALDISAPCYR